ncbi:hypothetical protein GA0115233_1002180 [Streptomyces sp. DI166]|nr:hypothetical protein GA0115233_1002180 [Streptomyces sp. DI166]
MAVGFGAADVFSAGLGEAVAVSLTSAVALDEEAVGETVLSRGASASGPPPPEQPVANATTRTVAAHSVTARAPGDHKRAITRPPVEKMPPEHNRGTDLAGHEGCP